MNARELLAACARLGATVASEEGRLVLSAPRPLAPELLARMRASRSELLAELGATPASSAQAKSISPRAEAATLLRRARLLGHRGRAAAMRDAWQERLAVCAIDGGIPLARAELVAVEELRRLATDWGIAGGSPAPTNCRFVGAETPLAIWKRSS